MIHGGARESNPSLLHVNHIRYPLCHGLVVRLNVVMLLLVPMTVRRLDQFPSQQLRKLNIYFDHIRPIASMESEGYFNFKNQEGGQTKN